MSDSLRSNPTPSLIPGPALDSPAAAFLRAEHSEAAPGAAKSVLLHELGVLEEHAADEMGAAREYLAAFNANPQFREPLEGLLRLLERRKSVKNLPKLLDALLRVAETPEERARALRKRAAFYDDVKADTVTARQALESSGAEDVADPGAWLALEVLAGKTSDPELRARALDERAKRVGDPNWRGLLLVAGAELAIKRADIEGAFSRLDQARELEGVARWPSLIALERLAAREVREGVLPLALEAQATLIEQAMANAEDGDRFGVPRSARTPVVAADALLRAADARRREGDLQSAASLLERALALGGMLPVVVAARLAVAESLGDTATADRMAQALLGQQVGARARASLWMRVAEAAASREDVHGALSALNEALKADPACVPARALQIDLLGSANDPGGLAGALESMAGELPTDEGKGRTYLLSAYVYALEAADVAGAKAALSQAGLAQVPALTLARVARLLAAATADSAWYDDALRRLLASGVSDKERLSIWYELGRTRLLRGDEEGATKAFDAMAGLPNGGWLGRALGAYALGLRAQEKGKVAGGNDTEPTIRVRAPAGPLDELRRAESEGALRRALALAAARRAERNGEPEGVRARLRELLDEDPNDLVAAAYLSEFERRSSHPVDAAKVLLSAAGAASPPDLAAALYIEAGILFFRANERAAAIDAFGAAVEGATRSASLLLGWALRGSTGADAPTAATRLERAEDIGDDSALIALQRAAIELASLRPDTSMTTGLLQAAAQAEVSEVGVAAALARLLVGSSSPDLDGLTRALDRLDVESEEAATSVSFERLRVARAGGDRSLACTAAKKLTDSSDSLSAAFEWLGATWAAEDRRAESEALRRIARYLPAEGQAGVEACAAMIELVDNPTGPQVPIDSPEPAARCMNLELAPAGSDPEQRAKALQGFGELLPDDGSRLDAVVMAGYNLLAQGSAQAALECFAKVTEQRDTDLFAWEGVRSAGAALGDAEREASASARLGELCVDDARAAQFFENAGRLYENTLEDLERAEACYARAFERDPQRGVAFDRLFRRVRERNESDRLLELIRRRLEVTEEPGEIAKLYWERARVLRQKGEVTEALNALEHVTLIEPDHVGALALKAEMDISQNNFVSAAANLSSLALLKQAPAQQRLMSGVAAADLYENKLGDTAKALEILIELHQTGLSTLPVRERLARAAAKTGSWERATQVLEELMRDRPTSDGRAEAARLTMAIWRDKLQRPTSAERAVARLLEELPGDAEALDLVLEVKFAPDVTRRLLQRGQQAVVVELDREPTAPELILRLSRIARSLGDWPLRQASLGALKAVGLAGPDADKELFDLDTRVARIPQVALDEATLEMVADPGDTGVLANLFHALAPSIAEALGPSLEAVGVTKKQRVDPRSGLPLRNEVASWAGALGLGEFELYVGGNDPHGAQGIPGEVPALVVGAELTAPLSPAGRQAIVRELFALRRGTSIVRTRDDTTVAAIVVAACELSGLHIDSPQYAVLSDVHRLLGKALSPRRARKLLPELCQRVVAAQPDARMWAKAALASMYRMAVISAGDVSLVLADAMGVPASRIASLVPHDERARRLIGFVLSPQYLDLRDRLGMGVT